MIMSDLIVPRRAFLKSAMTTAGALALGPQWTGASDARKPAYTGPNVIVVRFGGGVRRRETIDPKHTYAPFLCNDLTRRGTLFKKMEIDLLEGVETSHGQGTLYIVTGRYEKYKDVGGKFLG